MKAPLDGCALAKLLQDGPHVVQVAGCGQPRGESNALGARGQRCYVGSQDQAWPFTGGVETEARKGGDLSEVTDICLPPPHSLRHATLSQTLWSFSYGVWRVCVWGARQGVPTP